MLEWAGPWYHRFVCQHVCKSASRSHTLLKFAHVLRLLVCSLRANATQHFGSLVAVLSAAQHRIQMSVMCLHIVYDNRVARRGVTKNARVASLRHGFVQLQIDSYRVQGTSNGASVKCLLWWINNCISLPFASVADWWARDSCIDAMKRCDNSALID